VTRDQDAAEIFDDALEDDIQKRNKRLNSVRDRQNRRTRAATEIFGEGLGELIVEGGKIAIAIGKDALSGGVANTATAIIEAIESGEVDEAGQKALIGFLFRLANDGVKDTSLGKRGEDALSGDVSAGLRAIVPQPTLPKDRPARGNIFKVPTLPVGRPARGDIFRPQSISPGASDSTVSDDQSFPPQDQFGRVRNQVTSIPPEGSAFGGFTDTLAEAITREELRLSQREAATVALAALAERSELEVRGEITITLTQDPDGLIRASGVTTNANGSPINVKDGLSLRKFV
jgi:hypothetical protein